MPNPREHSPLRYPGGKACLTRFITELAEANNCVGGTYVELYAGGAGAALNLLFNGVFNRIHINDYDYRIYCLWSSILNNTDNFTRLIGETNVNIEEWHKQREIYRSGKAADPLLPGFATFFLNRTNRSGIIYKAGPIGGLAQKGNYLIDVRYNKANLIKRVEHIAQWKHSITLTNTDAIHILECLDDYRYGPEEPVFIYLDPPYYKKGKKLYLNNYDHQDHENLRVSISALNSKLKWLISYDNVSEIRKLYSGFRMSSFDLNYTLQNKRFGSELLVFSNALTLIDKITVNQRVSDLVLST